MKSIADLDQIYTNSLQKSYQELLLNTLKELKRDTGKVLFVKRNLVNEHLQETFKVLTMKKINPGNYLPNYYTHEVIRSFHTRKNDYETNPVTYFINEYLPQIKESYRNSEHSIPEHISMNDQELVELMGKYEAFILFLDRLESIDKADTVKICEKKLSFKGYIREIFPALEVESGILNANDDNEQSDKYKKGFTVNRQVLAIKYLFRHSGLSSNERDNTNIAEFIQFLTGRELGAKAIKNTNIYKRVISSKPENSKDLVFIRKFFLDLKLPEIVNLIDKEIKSASK